MSSVYSKKNCFICSNLLEECQDYTRSLRPSHLSCRIQDRPSALKPSIKVLEALEDISDGEVTGETLRRYAAHYICHECLVTLRGAVNKKTEVVHHMQELTAQFSEVSNIDRTTYYKGDYRTDVDGRCWGCLHQFTTEDYRKTRSFRLHLGNTVFEEMSAYEAIQSLLEHESEALLGLYIKKTYICRNCLQLLRNVVKSQCAFDILHIDFTSKVDENGVYARLLRGEDVPCTLQKVKEPEHCYTKAGKKGKHKSGSDKSLPSPTGKSKAATNKVKANKRNKRSHDKSIGAPLVVDTESENDLKKRKVAVKSTVEFDSEDNDINMNEFEDMTAGVGEDVDCVDEEKVTNTNVDPGTNTKAVKSKVDVAKVEERTIQVVSEKNKKQTIRIKGVTLKHKADNRGTVSDKTESDKSDISTDATAIIEPDIADPSVDSGESKIGSDSKLENKSKGRSPIRLRLNVVTKDVKLGGKGEGQNKILPNKQATNKDSWYGGSSTARAEEIKQTMSDVWVIYYWKGFSGRAEFIRLIYEEAGVPYRECEESPTELRRLINDGEMEGYPHFAPPMIKKGEFQLSQTPVICRYLGEELGLYPDSIADKLHAEQINLCCHDFIAEGRLSFHGINSVGPYLSQKVETQPYIDRFVSERLPRWLKYFERVLAANKGGKGFLFGDKLFYCDLSLFHVIHATEAQFPEAYKSADYIPLLKAFKERIAARPKISQYLRSDRWQGFSGDSMM